MLKRALLGLIRGYQGYVRPLLPCSCRFYPSCSEYTSQAIVRYGPLKGVFKGIARILRCHPFSSKSGYDPLV